MKAIQIMMDEDLLREIDVAVKGRKTDRSKLIRAATACFLRDLKRHDLEEQHRRGYADGPQDKGELDLWQEIASWPET
jgi:metal-responsive CopG/Arc/MetJ family transcriptional regulator